MLEAHDPHQHPLLTFDHFSLEVNRQEITPSYSRL